jgi:probable rRNA maturation factor
MTLLRRGAARVPETAVVVETAVVGEAAVVVEVAEANEVDDPDRWAALARSVLEAEGVVGPAELALSFVGEADMAELNRRWMGEDGPTDVLSWAIDAPAGRSSERPLPPAAGEPVLLGDVVVCPAVARRALTETGRRLEDELALLVVHGVLHVLGFDHAVMADEEAMQSRELEHLTRFHDRRWTRTS